YETEQERLGVDQNPKALLKSNLVQTPPPGLFDREAGRDVWIGSLVPDRLVDTVENAGKNRCARAQEAVEAHPALRRLDFRGIGGRYGRDPIGVVQTGFQES